MQSRSQVATVSLPALMFISKLEPLGCRTPTGTFHAIFYVSSTPTSTGHPVFGQAWMWTVPPGFPTCGLGPHWKLWDKRWLLMWWCLKGNAPVTTLAPVATSWYPEPSCQPGLGQPLRVNITRASSFNSQGLNSYSPLKLIVSVHISLH